MSFGTKLTDKDLVFDGAGKVVTVIDEEKLVQGFDKLLRTEQGRNFLHQLYGSTMYNLIGSKLTPAILSSLISKNLSQATEYFMEIQQNQRLAQGVTSKEIMVAVESVDAQRLDPRAVQLKIVVRTMNGSQATALTTIQN